MTALSAFFAAPPHFDNPLSPYLPVPVRVSVCGLFGALSVRANVPVAVPGALGANVMLTSQDLPAANVALQVVFEIANGEATFIPLRSSVASPLFTFLILIDLGLLVVPTACFAQSTKGV
jgi:hypothetical protein